MLVVIIIIAIALIAMSISIRYPYSNDFNFSNSDATYHVLLTMRAFSETPRSVHHFLPLVSLGSTSDKKVPWGATIPDKNGNYYYTSFSAAGFIAPYMFIKLLRLPTTIQSLYIFNSMIYVISWLVTLSLFLVVFRDKINSLVIVVFVTIIYLFSPEILHSQGIVYWHHSLLQVIIPLQILLFLDKKHPLSRTAFYLLCIITPYIEWTGYVSNIGFIVATFIQSRIAIKDKLSSKTESTIQVSFIISMMTLLSFLIYTIHFLSVVSYDSFFSALFSRFFARRFISTSDLGNLLIGYLKSFSLLPIMLVITLIGMMLNKNLRKKIWASVYEFWPALIVMTFPLIENIIMLGHASSYSFDRMKLVFPIIFFSLIIFEVLEKTSFNRFGLYVIPIFLITYGIVSIVFYSLFDNKYRWHITYLEANNKIAVEIKKEYNNSDSIIFQSLPTRGYTNLLFERAVYEGISLDDVKLILQERSQSYAIFLKAENQPGNVYRYVGYEVFDMETLENQGKD